VAAAEPTDTTFNFAGNVSYNSNGNFSIAVAGGETEASMTFARAETRPGDALGRDRTSARRLAVAGQPDHDHRVGRSTAYDRLVAPPAVLRRPRCARPRHRHHRHYTTAS
jgi:hypothetical protein